MSGGESEARLRRAAAGVSPPPSTCAARSSANGSRGGGGSSNGGKGIGGPHGYSRVCVVATVAEKEEEEGGARRGEEEESSSSSSGITMSSLVSAGVVDPKAYVNFSASPGDGNVHLLPALDGGASLSTRPLGGKVLTGVYRWVLYI